MKVGGVREGRIFGTNGATVGLWSPADGFESLGRLPNPATGRARLSFAFFKSGVVKRLLSRLTGWYTTANVWPVGDDLLLATHGRYLCRSSDSGRTWQVVYDLPPESGPMGVLPTSLCEFHGRLFLSEYAVGEAPARVLVSDDDGLTWSTYLETPAHRHFHGVHYDEYADQLWATTGDTDEQSAIGVLDDGSFEVYGSGSQRWRAVQLAFTPDSVIWGMDCSYAPAVEILELPRSELGASEPEPRRLTTVGGSVYYCQTLTVDDVQWVVVAVQADAGLDSTAPEGSKNTCSRSPKVVAAASTSGFTEWYTVCEFDRTRTLSEHTSMIPTASGYVYIQTDSELGLVVTPFNTGDSHGEVHVVPPEAFRNPSFPRHTGQADETPADTEDPGPVTRVR